MSLISKYFNRIAWSILLLVFMTNQVFAHEPLPANKAFKLKTTLKPDQVVLVRFDIAPKHYLYKSKIQFKAVDEKEGCLGKIVMPDGEMKEDPFFGKQEIYKNRVSMGVPILNVYGDKLWLEVSYQGCSEKGYCYPPTKKMVEINFKTGITKVKPLSAQQTTKQIEKSTESNIDRIFAWLDKQPTYLIPIAFIGFGLLLSLTPCTFPMIPILSSIILGYRDQITPSKAFFLSLTYVTSMASMYAIIGALAGFIGGNLQIFFQKPSVIIVFSSLLILLAACSFAGFYHFKTPAWIENHIFNLRRKQKAGTYIGVAAMGALSTLIVSPCITAPLLGVMSYISQTGNALLGGIALFFMGLGMGTPLLIIGTLEGKWLPKAGNWNRLIELVLGILLLGISIHLLSKVLPSHFILTLWGCLFLIIGLYLGAFFSRPREAIQWKTLRAALGLAILAYGFALIAGGLMGNDQLLSPLKIDSEKAEKPKIFKTVVSTREELNKALNKAKKEKKPVLLDFYAKWCTYCRIMEKKLFPSPEVLSALSQLEVIKVDVTKANQESRALLKEYKVIAPPAILFFNPKGEPLNNLRLDGEIKKAALLDKVSQIAI